MSANMEPMKVERRARNWDKSECYHALQHSTMKVTMAAGTSWRHAEEDPMVEVRRCLYCKMLLPLGPATDTAETEIEVIAVEIALMTDEERETKLDIDQFFAFGEGFGDDGADFPDQSHYNSGEQAAWLAAQIIQHEIEASENAPYFKRPPHVPNDAEKAEILTFSNDGDAE